jgi:galactokinase
MTAALRSRVVAEFTRAFGAAPARLFAAPGRVNLIGEHTDYNDGFVLPCAIDRFTLVAARPADGSRIEAIAADLDSADAFNLSVPIARSDQPWANYVRGVAAMLIEEDVELTGAQLAIAGDVPPGAGLSSSASLEIAVGLALAALAGIACDPTRLALIAQRAEREFVGCECGIMDQFIATHAEPGHALLIDCRSVTGSAVPMPADAALVIVDSGIRHDNVGGAYNDRRRQCAQAAAHYGVAALRDLDQATLKAGAAGLDPLLFRRARHVVSENERVLAAAEALAAGDLPALGRVMVASHASMRDDFEITVAPVDRLADLMNAALSGEGGARMTGGGFGGSVIAVAATAKVEGLVEAVGTEYRTPEGQPPAIFLSAAAGAAAETPL